MKKTTKEVSKNELLIDPRYREQYETYRKLPAEEIRKLIPLLSKPSPSQSEEENIQQQYMAMALYERQKLIEERTVLIQTIHNQDQRIEELLDSNRELLEALDLAKDIMTTYKLMDSKAGIRVEAAINNAKNNIV